MRKIVLGFVLMLMISLSSCSKCNICKKDTVEENYCTNSILDRAKAKSYCKKDGGEWLMIEE